MQTSHHLDDLTTMGPRPMWLVLLLPLSLCIHREATVLQKVEGEEFVAPLCIDATKQSETTDAVVLLVCSIRTQSSTDACRLIYHHTKGFTHGCGSRFRLAAENQTLLLHVTDLRAEDSGNYSCECSSLRGTTTRQFNVTVEVSTDSRTGASPGMFILVIASVSCVTIFTVVTGLFLGRRLRRSSQRLTVLPNTEPEEAEAYDTFLQRENSLYSDAVATQMYM